MAEVSGAGGGGCIGVGDCGLARRLYFRGPTWPGVGPRSCLGLKVEEVQGGVVVKVVGELHPVVCWPFARVSFGNFVCFSLFCVQSFLWE